MNKLFVYGIFLDGYHRNNYGMTNPTYDTVLDYITLGDRIVSAYPVDAEYGTALTGLVVDMNPDNWADLDRLESGYNRVIITTTGGQQAYMYVGKAR